MLLHLWVTSVYIQDNTSVIIAYWCSYGLSQTASPMSSRGLRCGTDPQCIKKKRHTGLDTWTSKQTNTIWILSSRLFVHALYIDGSTIIVFLRVFKKLLFTSSESLQVTAVAPCYWSIPPENLMFKQPCLQWRPKCNSNQVRNKTLKLWPQRIIISKFF